MPEDLLPQKLPDTFLSPNPTPKLIPILKTYSKLKNPNAPSKKVIINTQANQVKMIDSI